MKPRIYITRKLPDQLLKDFKEDFDVRMWPEEDKPVPRDVLLEEAKEAEGLLTMLSDNIDKELFESAKNLKVVSNLAVGFDNIDLEEAKKHQVIVTNTPDVLTETTADLGFALLMATARRITEAAAYVKEDRWQGWEPFLLAGADIYQKTIGIVGMGRIGEAVARRAKGFNMNILYHNRSRKPEAEQALGATYVSFDELLAKSDYLMSVVPLTDETKDMFNKQAFEKMKTSAIFINISRGGTVVEEDLIEALQQKQIQAAGLDVFREEPIRKDHPLLQLDNAVCIPHIGSASVETRTIMVELCLENIKGVIAGTGAKTPVE